jgi:hypothetical protein
MKAMFRVPSVVAFAVALIAIASCQESPVPSEDDSFARAFIDTLHTGSARDAMRSLSPRLARVPGIEDSLSHEALRLPAGKIDTAALIEARTFGPPVQGRATWRGFTYRVHSPGGYALVRLIVADELGHHFIDGTGVRTVPDSMVANGRIARNSSSRAVALAWAAVIAALAVGAIGFLRTPISQQWLSGGSAAGQPGPAPGMPSPAGLTPSQVEVALLAIPVERTLDAQPRTPLARAIQWLRPATLGAGLLGGIVLIRVIVALPRLHALGGGLSGAAIAIAAAAGAGAAGGLAYSITRPALQKLGRPGDYLTGIVIVGAYMGALALAAPYAFGERMIKDRADLVVFAALSLLFGLVIGHSWFGRREK